MLTISTEKHRLYINENLSDIEKQESRYKVQEELSNYFNNLFIGEDIILDKITQIIMNVSPEIIQEANIELKINGQKALYVNQSCRWFERFILAKEDDAIIIL